MDKITFIGQSHKLFKKQPSEFVWTAIVLTCQNKNNAHEFQKELEFRQKKGAFNPNTLIITVEDPKDHVGSGGATLNAILVITEHLSACNGYTVVNADVLENANILVLHMGRDYVFDPLGRAFASLPYQSKDVNKQGFLLSNFDILIHNITKKLVTPSRPGVWVGSLDLFLDIEESVKIGDEDVCTLVVPSPISYAKDHGVYHVDKKGRLLDMIYEGSEDTLSKIADANGLVPVISGVMFFSTRIAEKLISFHTMHPLDACTYMGLDSGATPIELSLFFDFTIAMCANVTQESFVSGEQSEPFGKSRRRITEEKKILLKAARSVLWEQLRGTKAVARTLRGSHSYLNDSALIHQRHLLENSFELTHDFIWSKNTHAKALKQKNNNSFVINSVVDCEIPNRVVISHSKLGSNIKLGTDCVLNGIDLEHEETILPPKIILTTFRINLSTLKSGINAIQTILGIEDDVMIPITSNKSSFCNVSWPKFFEATNIREDDLWENTVKPNERCLQNARLFPVFHPCETLCLDDLLWFVDGKYNGNINKWRESWKLSLKDILYFVDVKSEFKWRRNIFHLVVEYSIQNTLLMQLNNGLNHLYFSSCIDGKDNCILLILDKIASETKNPGIAARTLANIADVLGIMASSRGGLRSGPAGNKQWENAFQILEKGDIKGGVLALANEREKWINRTDLLVRTARHYEGAAQILIRQAVKTCKEFVKIEKLSDPPVDGRWIIATSPARIDFSGGWSDTPPISYEHGGAVTNIAIKINGERPITVKIRKIAKPIIMLNYFSSINLIISNVNDLKDYCQPYAPGALLKASLLAGKIVNLTEPLSEQLKGGGFEVILTCTLPQGSGLGASSILAGAFIAACWTATGYKYNISDVNHAVLYTEQLLTSGGGWQDQVGAFYPGVKIGSTAAGFPIKIEMKNIKLSEKTEKDLNDHLLLIYTGRTRLAKNLLQNVIRNWYARNPNIVKTLDDLVILANQCAKNFENGDFPGIGDCLNKYWQMKQVVAPGCTTYWIEEMMEALNPLAHGMCLAGAGGGGYMYVLMRDPGMHEIVNNMLINLECKSAGIINNQYEGNNLTSSVVVHKLELDNDGLLVKFD